jgi:hypothetical protein
VRASELVWTKRLEDKSFASARDRTPAVQSVLLLLTIGEVKVQKSKYCVLGVVYEWLSS